MTEKEGAPKLTEFLEVMELPTFFCDRQGRLLAASAGVRSVVGRELAEFESVFELFDGQPGVEAWTWRAPDRREWRVELRATAHGHAGWLQDGEGARQEDCERAAEPEKKATWLEEAGISRSQAEGLTRSILEELSLPKRDEDLLQSIVTVCQRLLPERLFCIKLIEPSSGELSKVLATGHLRELSRESVAITREGIRYFSGPERVPTAIEVSESYIPLFSNTVDGFDAPLYDGETFFGVLNVEYEVKAEDKVKDARIIGFVGLYFSMTLRFAHMLGESIYTREYFIKLLDTANAPILIADRHRRIKLINRAFKSLTGYSREETLDKDIKDFLSPRERERFIPAVVNALRGRSIGNLEVRIPHKKGHGLAHISLSLAAVRSGFGEIEGVVAVGQDLTELRKLQQQVIHSEKLATIGQLAAGVVHELNNPLTSISVYSEYLLRKQSTEGGDAGDITKLERICEGADRILKFTRDLVAYARPAAEEPRLVDLRNVVERSLVFCEHVIDRADVSVEREFEDELPDVYGVEGQLQQILVNLITNACDAMIEVENPRLMIGLKRQGEHVRLSLEDNGSGIPAADRARVFEPFFSTKPEGKGTGLGLSIVRNIIMNHDGEVWVEEGEAGGSRFVVELFASS